MEVSIDQRWMHQLMAGCSTYASSISESSACCWRLKDPFRQSTRETAASASAEEDLSVQLSRDSMATDVHWMTPISSVKQLSVAESTHADACVISLTFHASFALTWDFPVQWADGGAREVNSRRVLIMRLETTAVTKCRNRWHHHINALIFSTPALVCYLHFGSNIG